MIRDEKYDCIGGRLVSRETGLAIPEGEPVYVMRGKDEAAPFALREYVRIMELHPESQLAREHAASTRRAIALIESWQEANPDRVGMGCYTCDHLHRERLAGLDSLQLLTPGAGYHAVNEPGMDL